jgi:hypothetical protein
MTSFRVMKTLRSRDSPHWPRICASRPEIPQNGYTLKPEPASKRGLFPARLRRNGLTRRDAGCTSSAMTNPDTSGGDATFRRLKSVCVYCGTGEGVDPACLSSMAAARSA